MSEGNRKFSWVCLAGFILVILPVFALLFARVRYASMVLPWIYICAPLAGFIVSIVGLVNAKKNDKRGKGFAIAGIVLPSVVAVIAAVIIFSMLISSGNSAAKVHSNEMYGMGGVGTYVNTDYDVSELRIAEGYDFSGITVSDNELKSYAESKLDEITDKHYTSIRGKYKDYNFLIIKSDKLDVWLSYNCPGGFNYSNGYAYTSYAAEWEFAAYKPVPVDVYKDPSDKFVVITNCSDYQVISEFFGVTDNEVLFTLDEEPDMDKLKELYPEFFDSETPVSKGVEVYVWQMSAGSYSFGLMYGTNRNKTDEEIWGLCDRPLTLNEAKALLNECGVSKDEIFIIPVIQPFSSYAYEIDDGYVDRVKKMFEI